MESHTSFNAVVTSPLTRTGHVEGQEQALTALEGLSAVLSVEKTKEARAAVSQDYWPNIAQHPAAATTSKRARDLVGVIEALPSKAQVEYMVRYFLDEVQVIRERRRVHRSRSGHFLHPGVFVDELSQFEVLRCLGMESTIDPAWVSLLICVLW